MSEKDDEICCMNCRYRYTLEKLDWSNGGCEHSSPEGFICMASMNEKEANWMVGLDGWKLYCDCWEALK